MEVQYPFQTGCKVLRGTICCGISVYVYPFNAFAEVECPGQSAVVCSPIFSNTWSQLAVRVNFQQAVYQVGQVFSVLCSLALEHIEGFKLPGCKLRNNQVFDFIF